MAKPHYKKWRFFVAFAIVMGSLAAANHYFQIDRLVRRQLQTILPTRKGGSTTLSGVKNPAAAFNDLQDTQIRAAKKNGIKPIKNRAEAEVKVLTHGLVRMDNSSLYHVDRLTYSVPYLVPKAKAMLNDIARGFTHKCEAAGLPPHKIIVTSVLRTQDDVRRLRRNNSNASSNSCHCWGTTIDITYIRFKTAHGDPGKASMNGKLRKALEETLYELRQQGRCYVKYERKQCCYHITCR